MTLAIGRRVIIVDGAERWRRTEVAQHLVPALAQMPPETTLALFAREEGRAKAPAALHDAVKRAGGQVVAQMTVKPWELPKWAREQAARLGVPLDGAAAKALVAQVGERQQRLLRELEKLALEGDRSCRRASARASRTSRAAPRTRPSGARTRSPTRSSAATRREATRSYLRLREQGERLSGLMYLMAQRLRDALAVALRLQAGESAAEIKRRLRMPARAAERFVADVARTDAERLRAALAALADLELDTRGGAPARARSRTRLAGLGEDTLALRAIEAISQPRAVARRRGPLDGGVYSLASVRAARDFLRAPVFRCSAPRLTALSIVLTSSRCAVSAAPVAARDDRLQAAEVRLDRRRVAPVLQTLALGAQDPLLLGVDVGHGWMPRGATRNGPGGRAAPYYSGLVRQRRSLRRGAGRPRAAGRGRRGRRDRPQHRDLLDPHGLLAGRGACARNRLRELLRHHGPASAYTIAFLVPNLVANLFAQAALSAAFVPVFTDLLQQGRRKEALRLASTLFWIMLIGLGAITAFFILAAGAIMPLFIGPKFGRDRTR